MRTVTTAKKPPKPNSLAEFVVRESKRDTALTAADIADLARANGFTNATTRRVYYARWYYGVEPAAAATTAPTAAPAPSRMKPPVRPKHADELVDTILRHGTTRAREVIEAIETRYNLLSNNLKATA